MRPCAALLLLGTLGGCVHPPPRPGPAPVALIERAPPPPAGYYVWRPGHWRWNGYQYVWAPGRYVAHPA